MGIKVDHVVYKLPDSYVTKRETYKYVPSEEDPKIKVRTVVEVEDKGGYLVKFFRGHSIRCFDDAHLAALGFTTKPRLIDEASGLECDERGVPLDIAHLVSITKDGGGDMPELGVEHTSGDSIEAQVERAAVE